MPYTQNTLNNYKRILERKLGDISSRIKMLRYNNFHPHRK